MAEALVAPRREVSWARRAPGPDRAARGAGGSGPVCQGVYGVNTPPKMSVLPKVAGHSVGGDGFASGVAVLSESR
jgi:hypothetical protein